MQVILHIYLYREERQDPASPQGQVQADPVHQEEEKDRDPRHLLGIFGRQEKNRLLWQEDHSIEATSYGWQQPTDPPDRAQRPADHGSAAERQGCQNELEMKSEHII